MSLVSTSAFVLGLDPLSERDVVVSLLTRDHGVVRAVVKGGRGKGRKGAALQILTEVAVTYFRKEGADLARLDSIEIVRSSFELASRAESAMLLPYLAESTLTFVPESEPGGDVYRLLAHVVDALLAGADAGLSARYFEVWLLRFGGLLADGAVLRSEARACLAAIQRSKLTDLVSPGRPVLDDVEAMTRDARRAFLGHELKSYRFLRSLQSLS